MVRKIICLALIPLFLTSCAGLTGGKSDWKSYYDAQKQLQLEKQLNDLKDERQEADAQRKHEEKMLKLSGDILLAVGKTENKVDDVLGPLMIAVLEEKYQTTRMITQLTKKKSQPVPIKAPETFGEKARALTPLILGMTGLAVNWRMSENMADVAVAGINGAGHVVSGSNSTIATDSFKTGTDNVIVGNNNALEASGSPTTTTSTTDDSTNGDMCGEVPMDTLGTCSCASYILGTCAP